MEPAEPPIVLARQLELMKEKLQAAWLEARGTERAKIIRTVGESINEQLEQYRITETIHLPTYNTIETRTNALLKPPTNPNPNPNQKNGKPSTHHTGR